MKIPGWVDDYYANWWAPAVLGQAIYDWWQRRKRPPEPKGYAPGNVFVGRYKVPKDGWVRIENPRIRYMRQLPSGHAFVDDEESTRRLYPNASVWLIVEDGDFWPVMVHIDREST